MKSFVWFSCAGHMVMLTVLVVVGTLLSKPRMSYYSVDLMSSMPAGGGVTPGPAVTPETSPAIKAKVKTPTVAPRQVEKATEEDLPDEDTIRMLAKLKKKRMTTPKSAPRDEPRQVYDDVKGTDSSAPSNAGRGGSGLSGSGSGITVGTGGTPFPFPWYLKIVSDRIDQKWKAPQEFDDSTKCRVTFFINRSGEISGEKITRASGDSVFDQLGLRAVVYSNPMPPLPNGYPEDTLKVNMDFVGKGN